MNQIRVGSLFSGVGCIDLALQDVGMAIAWQCEIDPICRRVLERHWPNVTRYEDAREIDPRQIEPVDLVAAGFPCQDVSVAGLRAGLAGERSGLFFEFVRVVAVVHPRWILLENVDGLLSSFSPVEPPPSDLQEGGEWETEETSDLGIILSTLGDLGYGWAYRVFDAQYFGVAQRRKRVFIVGCFGDWASAARVLFESESCAGDSPPRREAREGATGINPNGVGGDGVPAIVATLNSGGNNGGFRSEPGAHPVAVALRGNYHCDHVGDESKLIAYQCQGTNVGEMGALRSGNGSTTGGVPFVAHSLTSEGADASEDGTGRGVPIVAFDTTQITSHGNYSNPKAGDPCHPLLANGDAPCVAFNWQSGGDVRLNINNVRTSPLSTTQTPAVAYGLFVRRIMPIECERLFGLDDGWTAHDADGKQISDWDRYRMLGNGVVRANVAWIGRRIVAVDQEVS